MTAVGHFFAFCWLKFFSDVETHSFRLKCIGTGVRTGPSCLAPKALEPVLEVLAKIHFFFVFGGVAKVIEITVGSVTLATRPEIKKSFHVVRRGGHDCVVSSEVESDPLLPKRGNGPWSLPRPWPCLATTNVVGVGASASHPAWRQCASLLAWPSGSTPTGNCHSAG